MLKIYKVTIQTLSYDKGMPNGCKTIGYYTSKPKADRIAKERYKNRSVFYEGDTHIEEIIVDDEN